MNELSDLIRAYPELGEVLANTENRLSYLENSQPTLYYIKEDIKTLQDKLGPQPTLKEVLDKLHRQEVLIRDLQNRLMEHISVSKQAKRDRL